MTINRTFRSGFDVYVFLERGPPNPPPTPRGPSMYPGGSARGRNKRGLTRFA